MPISTGQFRMVNILKQIVSSQRSWGYLCAYMSMTLKCATLSGHQEENTSYVQSTGFWVIYHQRFSQHCLQYILHFYARQKMWRYTDLRKFCNLFCIISKLWNSTVYMSTSWEHSVKEQYNVLWLIILLHIVENNCERLNLPNGIPDSLKTLKEKSKQSLESLKIFELQLKDPDFIDFVNSIQFQTYKRKLHSSCLHLHAFFLLHLYQK